MRQRIAIGICKSDDNYIQYSFAANDMISGQIVKIPVKRQEIGRYPIAEEKMTNSWMHGVPKEPYMLVYLIYSK